MPMSMYSGRIQIASAVSTYQVAAGRGGNPAASGVGPLPLGGAHVGRDQPARDADVCANHVERTWAYAESPKPR